MVDEGQVAESLLDGRREGLEVTPVIARQLRRGDDELRGPLDPSDPGDGQRCARTHIRGHGSSYETIVVHHDPEGTLVGDSDGHRLSVPVIDADPGAHEGAARIVRGHEPGGEGPDERTGPDRRHDEGDDARADPLVPLLALAQPVEPFQGERLKLETLHLAIDE
jgi:hypothetical protein